MGWYVISPAAEQDIVDIFAWTEEQFGEQARLRYEALIFQGIKHVAENPDCAGASRRPEIVAEARTYHLVHSRKRVSRKAGRVSRPRHLLLYRVADGGVEIARVLHDSLELARHLPEDYRADS